MYPVSDAYVNQIKSPVIRSRVIGTIGGVSFTDRNILDGSFSITNQCSGNEQVQIGQVYIGELNITLMGVELDRYTLDGLEIMPIYQLLTPLGYESIPLGHFYVGEANHIASGIVIKAYDAMSKFDRPCAMTSTIGTPYQLASLACTSCFVTLGTTAAEFSTFANANRQMTMYANGTDITTWRDYIAWVAQACGCFVTCDRNGAIVFRSYGRDVAENITSRQRFQGASFSDFTTKYTGIYVTNAADNTMTYYSVTPDDGLTSSLGANPFLQYGTEDAQTLMRREVLTALTKIQYVPFKVELVDDPRYDLGDVLSMPEGIGDADALFCVTKYVWSYHKGMTLEGVGKNPALATAQSKTDKNIQGLASRLSDDALHYYDFTNAIDFRILDGTTEEIIHLDFITIKDTHIDFHAEIKMEIDSKEIFFQDTYYEHDVTGRFEYYLSGQLVAYEPLLTEVDGIHLRHLLYTWLSSANVMGDFTVTLTAKGGDIIIPAGNINAYWAGLGLAGEIEDRNPHIRETVPALFFDMFGPFSDEITDVDQGAPEWRDTTDTLEALDFVLFSGFTEAGAAYAGIGITPFQMTDCIAGRTVPVEGSFWEATINGQYLETIDLAGVTGVLAPTGGALSYMCSFDGGTTWKGWNGTEWETNLTMTYETISSLSQFGQMTRVRAIFDAGETLGGLMLIGGHL